MALWTRIRPRGLTPGELAAARGVFGSAIAWGKVRIWARPFTPFQPKGTAVTPWGTIHFRAEDHLPDFSTNWADMAWLIHELTHVWQHQAGQWVLPRGLWERQYRYEVLDRPFRRYGIEQQAAIVEDWFRLSRNQSTYRGNASAAAYRATIPFLPERSGGEGVVPEQE